MTETVEPATQDSTTRDQALALIDGKLGEIAMRELVSRTEFTNVLLDLRLLLAADPEAVSVN